jgi:hypothetical protein
MMSTEQNRRSGRRFLRPGSPVAVLAAASVVALSVLVSGCGGSSAALVPQVASTKTSASGAPTARSSAKGDPAAYSACMRKNGVPNFPDPDSQGRIKITSGVSKSGQKTGVDTNAPQFRTAQKACQKLMPNGGRPTAQTQAKELQQALGFAKCMRSHGVPKFPDPKVNGDGGILQTIDPKTGVDPGSPQFKAAQQTCQRLVPGGPIVEAGGPTSSGPGSAP